MPNKLQRSVELGVNMSLDQEHISKGKCSGISSLEGSSL